MKTKFLKDKLKYDGRQLAPHFIYKNFNLMGDAMIAFQGPCEVNLTEMVDIEDVVNNEPIYSENMLHFIGEFFNIDLIRGVYMQRLLVTTIKEQLETVYNKSLTRSGDDLFKNNGKLSVSIATKSTNSILIHTALNITTDNTPIKTSGLKSDFGINNIEKFANEVLNAYNKEIKDIYLATTKVKGVI